MYEQFFQLRERPFALTPDPDYLYPSRIHKEALSYLRYGLEANAGFIVITGEIGSGKTTLLHTVLRGLDQHTSVSWIVNTLLESRELVEAIMLDFEIEVAQNRSKPYLLRELSRFLIEERRAGRRALLVIDEAQNLELAALEEVRMLSNLETEKSPLLQIALVGQPTLRGKLGLPELQQFKDRVGVSYHLGPLDAVESAAYINHRLQHASSGRALVFPPAVCDLIHRHSHGLPRRINIIADAVLLYAYGEGQKTIDLPVARLALDELEKSGVVPTSIDAEPPPRPRAPARPLREQPETIAAAAAVDRGRPSAVSSARTAATVPDDSWDFLNTFATEPAAPARPPKAAPVILRPPPVQAAEQARRAAVTSGRKRATGTRPFKLLAIVAALIVGGAFAYTQFTPFEDVPPAGNATATSAFGASPSPQGDATGRPAGTAGSRAVDAVAGHDALDSAPNTPPRPMELAERGGSRIQSPPGDAEPSRPQPRAPTRATAARSTRPPARPPAAPRRPVRLPDRPPASQEFARMPPAPAATPAAVPAPLPPAATTSASPVPVPAPSAVQQPPAVADRAATVAPVPPFPQATASPAPVNPAVTAANAAAADQNSVRTVVDRYRTAFNALDAAAAKSVWPSVDARSLGRAFGQLESQSLQFTGCQVSVNRTQAQAACDGSAAFVPKVGDKTPRHAPRRWTFNLEKSNNQWVIRRVVAQ